MSPYIEPVFERIRRIRLLRLKYLKDEGCKDKNVALFLGIKESMLKRIESGNGSLSLEIILKLSQRLKVSIEHILENKFMMEDQWNEPIVFRSQIGSVIHAIRSERMNNALQKDWREYTLKSVATKLGISSMELNRIEANYKSKHLNDPMFLKKLSELFELPLPYIEDVVETSFPRGQEKKQATLKNEEQVSYIKDGDRIRGLIVLSNKDQERQEKLKERIEFELSLLN